MFLLRWRKWQAEMLFNVVHCEDDAASGLAYSAMMHGAAFPVGVGAGPVNFNKSLQLPFPRILRLCDQALANLAHSL